MSIEKGVWTTWQSSHELSEAATLFVGERDAECALASCASNGARASFSVTDNVGSTRTSSGRQLHDIRCRFEIVCETMETAYRVGRMIQRRFCDGALFCEGYLVHDFRFQREAADRAAHGQWKLVQEYLIRAEASPI